MKILVYVFIGLLMPVNTSITQIDITNPVNRWIHSQDSIVVSEIKQPSESVLSKRFSTEIDSIRGIRILKENAAAIEFNESIVSDYQHRRKVFEWQLWSSRLIFWVVILLVLSGLVLSWMQFSQGSVAAANDKKEDVTRSAFKFSLQGGIEMTSPVIGLMILVISLAFFYLYLTEVYQIRVLD